MAAVGEEISADGRLLLIETLEGLADGIRKDTIRFSEGSARALAAWADSIIHPEQSKSANESQWKNITEACDLLGISQPTFRKYIRLGKIPQGYKRRGYHEPVWAKTDIERFANWYFTDRRKV